MRTLTDEEKEKLMNELVQSIKDKHIKYPYEITRKEFAEATGTSDSYSKKYLSQAVKDGRMAKRWIVIDGQSFMVYSVI